MRVHTLSYSTSDLVIPTVIFLSVDIRETISAKWIVVFSIPHDVWEQYKVMRLPQQESKMNSVQIVKLVDA